MTKNDQGADDAAAGGSAEQGSETPATARHTELRMHAYYFGFSPTGIELVDRILSAIAHAGKGYHHTENWTEPTEDWGVFRGGEYGYAGWIQRAAEDAAASQRELLAQARQYLDDMRHPVTSADSRARRIAAIEAAIAKAEGRS